MIESDKMAFYLGEPKGPLCLASDNNVKQTSHRIVLPYMHPEPFNAKDLLFGEKSSHFVTGHESINRFLTEGNSQMTYLLLQTFFLCKCSSASANRKPDEITVIYVDAYPGNHINYLADMFKHVSFRLYDSAFAEQEGDGRVKHSQKVKATDRIRIIPRAFTEGEARTIADEFAKKKTSLFYISLLRNHKYSRKNSAEVNSAMIDSDQWEQLNWARIMKPAWSLIRYRPKLEIERPLEREDRSNVSDRLTDTRDPIAKRRLYYNYPPGYFLRSPMIKKSPNTMFLMTCAAETNGYTDTRTYYHDDIISLCRHQNEYVRRVEIYMNPYSNTYSGIYGLQRVEDFISKYNSKVTVESQKLNPTRPERYICGAGWDHRAMYFIMTLYVKWKYGITDRNGGEISASRISNEAIDLILKPFLEMERGLEEQAQEEVVPIEVTDTSSTYVPENTDEIEYGDYD